MIRLELSIIIVSASNFSDDIRVRLTPKLIAPNENANSILDEELVAIANLSDKSKIFANWVLFDCQNLISDSSVGVSKIVDSYL